MGVMRQTSQDPPIRSFTDLNTWKKGHLLVIQVHSLLKSFPKEQQFVLVSQMSRASISITSNIAEGFSRLSNKEKTQFYYIAQGSLTELQNQLLISRDLGYISTKEFIETAQETVVVHKLLSGLIKHARLSIRNT
jgi:four helix bundle protein